MPITINIFELGVITVIYMANNIEDFDRPRGIFTPRDRRFLAGELEEGLTPNAERQKRYKLRQRVLHALQDLGYLRMMETRDLAQLTDIAGHEAEQGVTDIEQYRVWTGITEFLDFVREAYEPELFTELVRRELEIRAKLDHYEETGEYGDFDVEITVTRTDSTPIEELLNTPRANPPNESATPGMWEVLSLHDEREGIEREWREYTPTEPELAEHAFDVIGTLDGGDGAPREQVVSTLVDEHGATAAQAEDSIEDLFLLGRGYAPEDGRLKVI